MFAFVNTHSWISDNFLRDLCELIGRLRISGINLSFTFYFLFVLHIVLVRNFIILYSIACICNFIHIPNVAMSIFYNLPYLVL